MKPALSFLMVLPLLLAPHATQSADPTPDEEPTHILELRTEQSDSPVPIEAKLYSEEGQSYVSVALPDGERVTAEYILTKEGAIKFQLTRIAGNGLVAIQFVGSGNKDGRHKGAFTGFVDGELRKDMSGTFVLSTKP